jgi:hypothetical protein
MRLKMGKKLIIGIIIACVGISGCYFIYSVSKKYDERKQQELNYKIRQEVEKCVREIESTCKTTDRLDDVYKLMQHKILWIDIIGKPAAEVLIKELKCKEKNEKFRIIMAQLLAMVMNPEVVPELGAIAKDKDEMIKIRIAAIVALGRINDESAVPILKEILDNEVFELQMPAVYALGEIRNEEAIDILEEKLYSGKCNPELEKEIKIALSKVGQRKKYKGPWWPGKTSE